jgi:hypothetical protein
LTGISKLHLLEIEKDLLVRAERSFWEVTDRQVSFDWVSPERRPFVKQFLASLDYVPCEPMEE